MFLILSVFLGKFRHDFVSQANFFDFIGLFWKKLGRTLFRRPILFDVLGKKWTVFGKIGQDSFSRANVFDLNRDFIGVFGNKLGRILFRRPIFFSIL